MSSDDKIKMSTSWSFHTDTVERWAYWDSAFSDDECDSIIEYAKSFKLIPGNTVGDANEIRKSSIVFLHPDLESEWLYRRLTDMVTNLNDRFFKFDLHGFNEGLQFTEYVAPHGNYGCHIDKVHGKVVRKLSIVLQLTNPDTYEGGDFELMDTAYPEKLSRKRGTLLIFPSYSLHKVTPVTKGVRNSLVGWVAGPPFK
jgi:PKHD-type hydroxylase